MKLSFPILFLLALAPLFSRSQTIEIANNNAGLQHVLKGNWELVVTDGNVTSDKNENTNTDKTRKIKEKEIVIGVDSTVKVNADGSVETTITTVYRGEREDKENRYTPLQSDRMHKAEKPSLRFFGESRAFSGFTGCNKLAGLYEISRDNEVDLSVAAPSTRMACIGGYDEEKFMNGLKSVTHYKLEANKLILLKENLVIFTFTRID